MHKSASNSSSSFAVSVRSAQRVVPLSIGLVVATLLFGYYNRMYVDPISPMDILFIQTVTVTGPVYTPSSSYGGASGESGSQNTSGILTYLLNDESVSADLNAASTPTTAAGPPVGPFARKRFSSKTHMISPVQLVTDYPMSYWLCTKAKLIDVPFYSANLVSLMHPIFGLWAGLLIARAIKPLIITAKKEDGPHCETTALTVIESNNVGSGGGGGGVTPPVTPAAGALWDTSGSNGCTAVSNAVGGGGGGGLSEPHTPLHPLSTTTAGFADGSPSTFTSDSRVNLRQLRIACCLFSFRNFLDTLDGVTARLHRRRAALLGTGAGINGPTTFGLNGHTVDAVTDVIGVLCTVIGIIVFLFRAGPILSRPFYSLCIRCTGVRPGKVVQLSQLTIIAGLAYIAFVSAVWERTMLRYSNLFDVHADFNRAIFELENDPSVRLNQFFWAFSCGDSIFTVLITALFFNKVWTAVQAYAFFGYVWLVLLFAHTWFVWNYVILANPAALSIVQDSPSLF